MALNDRCVRCGRRAEGWAFIRADRLCHSDGLVLTCYDIARRLHWADPVEWEVQKQIWRLTRDPVEVEVTRLFDECEERLAARSRHPSQDPTLRD